MEELKGEYDEIDDEFNNIYTENTNLNEIKRCEDFKKMTYNVFKTTMYNEGLKIKKNKILNPNPNSN